MENVDDNVNNVERCRIANAKYCFRPTHQPTLTLEQCSWLRAMIETGGDHSIDNVRLAEGAYPDRLSVMARYEVKNQGRISFARPPVLDAHDLKSILYQACEIQRSTYIEYHRSKYLDPFGLSWGGGIAVACRWLCRDISDSAFNQKAKFESWGKNFGGKCCRAYVVAALIVGVGGLS